jgi:hypothetical protein
MRLTIAFVLAALAAGCGSHAKGAELLLESVRTYHEGLRWGRIPVAASRVPADERAEFIADWDALADDLRITDYEVIAVAEAERAAKVEVKYTWYLDSRQVVHDTRIAEEWERLGDIWIKVAEHLVRGEPMPTGASETSDVSLDDSVEARGD